MSSRRLFVLVLALAIVAAALILGAWSWRGRTVSVTHDVISSTYVDNGAGGPSVGDMRFFEIATKLRGGRSGRMDATMTTTGEDNPEPGAEIRMSQLIFTFGNENDQIVVTGVGVYPAAGSVLAENTTTVRPITGGSGIYSGAGGWCESIHYADGTWRHIFHLER